MRKVKKATKKKAKGPARKPASPTVPPMVRRLAAQGVESADIATALDLVGVLQADATFRAEFDAAVAKGHATHRVELAQTLKERAAKGGATALRDSASAWLSRYSAEPGTLDEADAEGIAARIHAMVAQLRKRHAG